MGTLIKLAPPPKEPKIPKNIPKKIIKKDIISIIFISIATLVL
jgi:hypothetical protein